MVRFLPTFKFQQNAIDKSFRLIYNRNNRTFLKVGVSLMDVENQEAVDENAAMLYNSCKRINIYIISKIAEVPEFVEALKAYKGTLSDNVVYEVLKSEYKKEMLDGNKNQTKNNILNRISYKLKGNREAWYDGSDDGIYVYREVFKNENTGKIKSSLKPLVASEYKDFKESNGATKVVGNAYIYLKDEEISEFLKSPKASILLNQKELSAALKDADTIKDKNEGVIG